MHAHYVADQNQIQQWLVRVTYGLKKCMHRGINMPKSLFNSKKVLGTNSSMKDEHYKCNSSTVTAQPRHCAGKPNIKNSGCSVRLSKQMHSQICLCTMPGTSSTNETSQPAPDCLAQLAIDTGVKTVLFSQLSPSGCSRIRKHCSGTCSFPVAVAIGKQNE